jgi:formyltetrahydrofolate synthetase
MHGGGPEVKSGAPLAPEYTTENLELVESGCVNVVRHVKIAQMFGVPVVVAVNKFPSDTAAELEIVRKRALQAGAYAAVVSDACARGGAGAVELADAVVDACSVPSDFQYLYPLELSLREKIETIATRVYGADGIDLSEDAASQIQRFEALGYSGLPICMAKTPLSISHDPTWKGVPSGYTLPVREIRASIGAGFIYPLCGAIRTMPGLPVRPAFMNVDLDADDQVVGLS